MSSTRTIHLVFVIILAFGPSSFGQGSTSPTFADAVSNDPEYLRRMAASDREFAADQFEHARQWHGLADTDRKYATESDDPTVKQDWLNSAQKNDQRAQDLEDMARQLLARANHEDALAGAAAAPAPTTPPPAPSSALGAVLTRHADLVDFVGLWKDAEHNVDFILEAANINDPLDVDRVKLTGKKVKWSEGTFEPGDQDGRPSRFTFEYFPKWNEMSAKIPEWARHQIEGKLKWKLEFTHEETNCVCIDGSMQAVWHPGEVKWTDSGGHPGQATVSGEGDPVKFDLVKADDDVDLQGYFSPSVVVSAGDLQRALTEPVEYLIKREKFQLYVLMSRDEAKAHGDSIVLTVRNRKTGATTTVPLGIEKQTRNNQVVRYEQQTWQVDCPSPAQAACPTNRARADHVTIADPRSANPLLFSPDRMDLVAGNGDEIEFDFEGASQSIRIYDSLSKLELARYDDEFVRLSAIFQAIVSGSDPKFTMPERELARRHILLLQHARAFLEDVNSGELELSEKGTDYTGVAAGSVHDRIKLQIAQSYYQQLIFAKDQRWLTATAGATRFGFSWASMEEQHAIADEIIDNEAWRARISYEILHEAVTDGARGALPITELIVYGLPALVFHMTPAGDAYIVITGQDILGNKLDMTDRIGAAIGLGLSALSVGLDVANALQAGSRIAARAHHLSQLSAARELIELKLVAGKVESLVHLGVEEGAAERAVAGIEAASAEVSRCFAGASPLESGGARNLRQPVREGGRYAMPASIEAYYPRAKIVDAPAELGIFKQKGPSCRFASEDVNWFKQTGGRMEPDEGLRLRHEMGIQNMSGLKDAEDIGPRAVTPKELIGMKGGTDGQVAEYANALGGWASSGWMTIPEISAMHQKGWGMSVGIFLKDAPGLHQVAIWDIEYGPVGKFLNKPKTFVLFDTNFPDKLIRIAANDLDAMLLKPSVRYWNLAGSGAKEWRYSRSPLGHLVPSASPVAASSNVDYMIFPKVAN